MAAESRLERFRDCNSRHTDWKRTTTGRMDIAWRFIKFVRSRKFLVYNVKGKNFSIELLSEYI